MTNAEKIIFVKTLVENDEAATDALVTVYLSQAESNIMRRLYRAYSDIPSGAAMPSTYDGLQCELAARRFLRRGAQPELSHNENGVNRSYHSTDDEELLKDVLPYARIL